MNSEQHLWFNEWPANGFYWLRGWRHYGDLPISVDGDSFWMMFALAKYHRTDLDDGEDVQFLGPITPYTAVVAAEQMRSVCVSAIKSLRATPHGAAYNNAINDAIHKCESVSIERAAKEEGNDG